MFDKYKVENQYQCAFQIPNQDFAQLIIDIPDTKNLIVNTIGDFTYLIYFSDTFESFKMYVEEFIKINITLLTMDEYLPKIIYGR